MISKEEAIVLALKTSGYSDQEIAQELKEDGRYKFFSVQEGNSDWRPNGWCPYVDKLPDKYYSDCWVVYTRPSSTNRYMQEHRLIGILDGPEDWYWIDKYTGVIVYKGGCGGG